MKLESAASPAMPAERTRPGARSAYRAATIEEDLDGAGKPGSDDGPVQYAHQPKSKEAEIGERAGG